MSAIISGVYCKPLILLVLKYNNGRWRVIEVNNIDHLK